MRKLKFSSLFPNRYSTFLGFPKSQQENMASSSRQNISAPCLFCILELNGFLNIFLNVIATFWWLLVIFFVYMTFRYYQRQKSFFSKIFFQPLISEKMSSAQRKIFFQKMSKILALWQKARYATPYLKQNDRIFLSLSLSIYI